MSSQRSPTVARVPVIGLTGAVGAGKTTAAASFAEAGCTVIDVDRLGQEALDDPSVRDAVERELGPGLIVGGAGGGRLDRRAVAARAFADRDALRRLEAIVHPVVATRLGRDLEAAADAAPRAVVVDCALLFESGLDVLCDETIVVEADEALRLRRVAAARGWTHGETRGRAAAQLPPEEKRMRADRAIANDGDAAELRRRVREALDEIAPVQDRSRTQSASGRNER